MKSAVSMTSVVKKVVGKQRLLFVAQHKKE